MGKSITRISNLIVKELIQFRRDRVLAMFILLAPALQLFLMAQNVERGITEQPVAVLDQDRSRLSRQLVAGLDNTEELHVTHYVQNMEQARHLLDQGSVRLAVVIPVGLAQGLRSPSSLMLRQPGRTYPPQGGQATQIAIIADATNTLAASTTLGAATGAVERMLASVLPPGQGEYGSSINLIDVRADVRFNPAMDFRDFSIPAQLGFITYQVTLAVAALSLARERELGTLEQLLVTPLRHAELTFGKSIPAIAVGSLNFAVMWAISLLVFQVPMHGSVVLLAAMTLLFVATVVNWGMVISAVSRTQQQAILFVFILAMMEITFSGFLVPVKNMPPFLQWISRFAPLQHYLIIIRSIMLKGAGLQELWPQVVALLVLSLVMGLAAMRVVARRLD
jgi:ABC-2 type transport system permease protein